MIMVVIIFRMMIIIQVFLTLNCTSAAAALGTEMALSTWSTTSMEDVATAAPGGLRWLQINIFKDRELLQNLVNLAENLGYKALFLGVDKPVAPNGHYNQHRTFVHPPHCRYFNISPTSNHGSCITLGLQLGSHPSLSQPLELPPQIKRLFVQVSMESS